MAYKFFVLMQKRADGKTYCDLHKTDEKMYLEEATANKALADKGDLAKHFHVVPIVAELEEDYDRLYDEAKL
jgi:hypothetical protein